MADEDKDLVSEVKVTGTQEATQALQDYAEKGGKAFDDLADSAAKAGAEVAKSTDKSSAAAKGASKNMVELAEAQKLQEEAAKRAAAEASRQAAALSNVEKAAANFSKSAVKAAKDITQFVTKVAGIAAAAAAAGAGIAALAAKVSKSQGEQVDAFEKTNQAQQQAVQTSLNAQQSAIQYEEQQRQLNRQLAQGTITYDQYAAALKSNRQAYQDQIRVTARLEAAQESARLETERLQKSLADRKATQALVDTYGGPLTSALIALGDQIVKLKKGFIDALGPGLATILNTATSALTSNGSSIIAFFDSVGAKISAFAKDNAPAIQQALSSIGTAASVVFQGIIDALPSLLNLFNNALVPAFKAVAAVADTITLAFNGLFGTKFTTGALVITAAILSMAGGFKTLLTSLQLVAAGFRLLGVLFAANPVGLAITALIAVIALLYLNWDTAVKAMGTTWQYFANIVGQGVKDIEGFFATIGTGLSDGFTAAKDAVVAAWNAVVKFFADLPSTLGNIFTQAGQAISNAFFTAFDAVKNYLLSWVETVKGYLQPIVDLIKYIGSAGSGDGPAAVEAAGGGKIRGPGTSTSDSIPAWLSNNEYVIRAKAVRKYGTAFMNAVNRGTFDPRRFIQGFARGGSPFAGLAPSLKFAPVSTGGGGASGGTLNLTIGDQSFDGLQIPDRDTAEALSRYVVSRQLASGGRPPSWKMPKR